jgi:hypothetical protein
MSATSVATTGTLHAVDPIVDGGCEFVIFITQRRRACPMAI